MALTTDEETILRAMIAEFRGGKDAEAQVLIDAKQTAEGQLAALKPYLSAEQALAVDAELKVVAVKG